MAASAAPDVYHSRTDLETPASVTGPRSATTSEASVDWMSELAHGHCDVSRSSSSGSKNCQSAAWPSPKYRVGLRIACPKLSVPDPDTRQLPMVVVVLYASSALQSILRLLRLIFQPQSFRQTVPLCRSAEVAAISFPQHDVLGA